MKNLSDWQFLFSAFGPRVIVAVVGTVLVLVYDRWLARRGGSR